MNSVIKRNAQYWPILGTLLFAIVAIAQPAHAQSAQDFLNLRLFIDFSGSDNRIFQLLGAILNFVLLIGGILAFFYAIQGGFAYLTSGGDATKAENGRKMITNAVIGIIIIFLSYAIISFVVNKIANPSAPGSELLTPRRQ
jgi:hypothetical protein